MDRKWELVKHVVFLRLDYEEDAERQSGGGFGGAISGVSPGKAEGQRNYGWV